MSTRPLPHRLYVQWYEDKGGGWDPMAHLTRETALDADLGLTTPGKQVGVYQLVQVVELRRGPVIETPKATRRRRSS